MNATANSFKALFLKIIMQCTLVIINTLLSTSILYRILNNLLNYDVTS